MGNSDDYIMLDEVVEAFLQTNLEMIIYMRERVTVTEQGSGVLNQLMRTDRPLESLKMALVIHAM